jgi:oligopeptide transport system ATP-binding protein
MTSLNPVFTIGKQIIETFMRHQDLEKPSVRDKTVALLRDVGIPNPAVRIDQYPHEYSGGMRQRAMIAMALACEPKILIADEPTTALDVTIQAQILDLMNRLKSKRNSSIIIITHDLGVLAEMADTIIVMYGGRIVEYADTCTIFYDPSHPYTWGLLASMPRLDQKGKRLIPIEGNPPSMLDVIRGCSYHPRCRYAKEVCLRKVPELRTIEGNHQTACHLPLSEIEEIKRQKIFNNDKR